MTLQTKAPRRIWQPYNGKSQILTTIAVLLMAGCQLWPWYNQANHRQQSQPFVSQPDQEKG